MSKPLIISGGKPSAAVMGLSPARVGYSGKVARIGDHSKNTRSVLLMLEKALREKTVLQASPVTVSFKDFVGKNGSVAVPVFLFDLGGGISGILPAFETGLYKAAEASLAKTTPGSGQAPVGEASQPLDVETATPVPGCDVAPPDIAELVSVPDAEAASFVPATDLQEATSGGNQDYPKPHVVKPRPINSHADHWSSMLPNQRGQIHRRMVAMLGGLIPFHVVAIKKGTGGTVVHLSRKSAVNELSAKTWESLEAGQERIAVVTGIVPNKAYCEIDSVPAILPITEIDHVYIKDIYSHVAVGSAYNVKVLSADREKNQVVVSTKALLPNPWEAAAGTHKPGDYVTGTVLSKNSAAGKRSIHVRLQSGLPAVAQVPAFHVIQTGDPVVVRIITIDIPNCKISAIITHVLPQAK